MLFISLKKQWKRCSSFLTLMAVLVASLSMAFPSVQRTMASPEPYDYGKFMAAPLTAKKDISVESETKELADPGFYKGLPVGNISYQAAPNSWATAVFLPQYHRYPGSAVEDPHNNQAEVVQGQTYQILQKIFKEMPIRTVVIEGEQEGKVNSEKRKVLAQKMQNIQNLENSFHKLQTFFSNNSFQPALEQGILGTIKNFLASLHRETILEGAPVKLWAEGGDFEMFGTENPQTLEESKVLVRDYIYLKDRLASLGGGLMGAAIPLHGSFNSHDLLRQLLQKQKPSQTSTFAQNFHLLESYAQTSNKTPTLQALKEFKQSWNDFMQTRNPAVPVSGAQATGPSRSDNPYNAIQNRGVLQQLKAENEAKIQQVVVDRRNQEAANSFSKALQNQQQNLGILQFGAGHKQGLIQELLKLGISVVVVEPEGVTNPQLVMEQ